jgi:hypothetical protein
MFSSKLASWIALAAALCFIALVALQVAELMSYRAPPSVWPTAL